MPPKEHRGRLGRIVVIVVYAVALSYLVIVGFTSVIPQVFWPESDASFDLSCEEGLRVLFADLEGLRLEYLSASDADDAELQSSLAPWDLKFNALRDRCDEDKVHLLNKYRYRVELNLQRYVREDAPFADHVAEALTSTPKTTPPNPTELNP